MADLAASLSSSAPISSALPGFGVLLRLKMRLLRNRLGQLATQSPGRLMLIVLFVGIIWGSLYALFDHAFLVLRRYDEASVIAIPYVFHIFFVAMTALLTFSTAVLAYSGLFRRPESCFLMSAPNSPRNVVLMIYVESLFFSSWSLLLLGFPLMLAIGRLQSSTGQFYATFLAAFLGFVPIPGAVGLLAALAVALWFPRSARRMLIMAAAAALGGTILWWGRLWAITAADTGDWLTRFLSELQYLKAAMLPSTWVTKAIRFAIEGRPGEAGFYLLATVSTAFFFSWIAVNVSASWLLQAFSRAHAAPTGSRAYSGWASEKLAHAAFFYLPRPMRWLILKDLRSFFRDPMQWSQLLILFGLLGLYLAYLPRARPEGFTVPWKALMCFLNFGAVTLILSTFTSRFVFPMVSLEGRQMWLVGLWPLRRQRVLWAKFLYAFTLTASVALPVCALSMRALDLPPGLAIAQAIGTMATCGGLCALAVGLGACLPSYREPNAGRIASGLGGTVNLIASIGLVGLSVGLFGWLCTRLVAAGSLERFDVLSLCIFLGIPLLGLGVTILGMKAGNRAFLTEQF